MPEDSAEPETREPGKEPGGTKVDRVRLFVSYAWNPRTPEEVGLVDGPVPPEYEEPVDVIEASLPAGVVLRFPFSSLLGRSCGAPDSASSLCCSVPVACCRSIGPLQRGSELTNGIDDPDSPKEQLHANAGIRERKHPFDGPGDR